MTKQRRPTKGLSRDDQETPKILFDLLDAEFAFDIDLAANRDNWKIHRWIGPPGTRVPKIWRSGGPVGADALSRRSLPLWFVRAAWVNPPFSRPLLARFIRRAREVADAGGRVVGLIPAALETRYFQEDIVDVADEIRILDQRLRFQGHESGAPIPNVIVVWRRHLGPTRWIPFHVPRNAEELDQAVAELPGIPEHLGGMGRASR